METIAERDSFVYSPNAIINLVNNAVVVPQSRKMITVKGIYQCGNNQVYGGYYYDTIKDETTDSQLTLFVPQLTRRELTPGKAITFHGFINRRVNPTYGRIEIQIVLSELVEQTHSKYTEEDVKILELQQKKASAGYRDVQTLIKTKIINGEKIKIIVIIGKTGIIDDDIKHQMRESISNYNLSFHRVSLTSESEIINAIKQFDNDTNDIIVVSRGGGESLEIFNKPSIAETCINLIPYFITAIGHKVDITLLQKVADKAFITPSEFGQFLNDVFNQTIEELQNSKAKLVKDITEQLRANYDKQISNLNDRLKAEEQLKSKSIQDLNMVHEQKVKTLNLQIDGTRKNYEDKERDLRQLRGRISELESKGGVSWIAVIIALIIGLAIGAAMSHH